MTNILKKAVWIITPFMMFGQSCGIYSFKGSKIPAAMKTVTIQFFENTAPLVVPRLSKLFTDALTEKIRTTSRLSTVRADGDAVFEGRITDYSIKPTAIQGNDRAGLNRLTITVSVKYTNTLDATQSFEESFSRFKDFSTAIQTQQSQEENLIRDINAQLTEDIFNRAFANW